MVRRVTDGPVGVGILKKLEPKGIVGLAYWDAGFKIFAANKPIRRPQDVNGLRLRMSAKVYEPMFLTLGATPIEMGFGATIKALQEGRIDGNENTPANLYTRKLHELQPHMTVTNHVYLGYAVVANKKFWDSLPNDLRVSLKLALMDATRYANLYAERQNEQALANIKASGKTEVYAPSIDELNAWRRVLKTTHKQFATRPGGQELLQAIYDEGAALGYRF
jgi:C4-dicarboxylate-binding protein DctP